MDESNTTKYAGKSAVPFGPLAPSIATAFSNYAGVLFLHVSVSHPLSHSGGCVWKVGDLTLPRSV